MGVHIQQPGLRRVQPGDGEALLPPGHTDAVKGVDLVEGKDVQIHVGQVGDQALGHVGLLQGEGLPVQQVEPLDVEEGLLRRAAQAAGVQAAGGPGRLQQQPGLRPLGRLLQGLLEAARRLQVLGQLLSHHKDALALDALQKALADEGGDGRAHRQPVDAVGLRQGAHRWDGRAGEVLPVFDLAPDELPELEVEGRLGPDGLVMPHRRPPPPSGAPSPW